MPSSGRQERPIASLIAKPHRRIGLGFASKGEDQQMSMFPSSNRQGTLTKPHLKLVCGSSRVLARHSDGPERVTVCRLMLSGCREDRNGAVLGVRPSAWFALLDTLAPHERLGLTHRFAVQPRGRMHYAFDVSLQRTRDVGPGMAGSELRQALGVLLPGLAFDVSRDEPDELPVQALLRPAPLCLSFRDNGAGIEDDQYVPYPAGLTSGPLAVGFDEPVHEMAWDLQLDVARTPVSHEELCRLHRVRQELRRGARRIHRVDSPREPYVHDTDLDERVQVLVGELLARPGSAYTLDVTLRSEQPFSTFALKRIARGVFGAAMPVTTCLPGETAGKSWPLLPVQGTGGIFAAHVRVRAAGVPTVRAEPETLPTGPGLVVAHTHGGSAVIMPEAHVTSHTLVVGASGSGKSTLLQRIAGEAVKRGDGLALICPHGQGFLDQLGAIPSERAGDVVVIDVADSGGFSVALNPLAGTHNDPALRRRVSGLIVDLMDRLIERQDTSGPQTHSRLRNFLMLAMCHPEGGTLADVPRLLSDATFRNWLLAKADPSVVTAIKQFHRTTGDQSLDNWAPYLAARFEPFTTNISLLRMFNRPSTVDLADLMERRAIVLVNLSKATLGETECQLAGSLLLMQFHIAAMRACAAGRQLTRPYQLIVDEAHSFVSPVVAQLLREARKFGLGVTLATQAVEALRHPVAGDLSTAVLANTATKVFMRLSPREAIQLDEYTAPEYLAQDLVRMPNYQGVFCLPAAAVPPFVFTVAQPEPAALVATEAEVRALSGKRYGTAIAEVDQYLVGRHGIDPSELPQRAFPESSPNTASP